MTTGNPSKEMLGLLLDVSTFGIWLLTLSDKQVPITNMCVGCIIFVYIFPFLLRNCDTIHRSQACAFEYVFSSWSD